MEERCECTLQHASSIERLVLRRNVIPDITPLRGLTNLEEPDPGINDIEDITALRDLINLESIDLDRNVISDIAPLENLRNLENLNIWANQISVMRSAI